MLGRFLTYSLAHRTQMVYICLRLLGTPCWCLLSMLTFILYKNGPLTPLQITMIIALKPTSSLLSPYWTQAIYQRPDRIITNLMAATFFRHLPFLLIPWIHSPWFIIFSFGLYMTLGRATIPAWMELFKYKLPNKEREQVVGYGTTIEYLGTALLSVCLGLLLDHHQELWRWLFATTACLGIFSTFSLCSLQHIPLDISPKVARFDIKDFFLKPWKQVCELLAHHKEFTLFQAGFMLCGSGLMIMQPALPKFFIDILHLSFTEMGVAIALCKGIGVAFTSPLWTRLFRKITLFQLCALVTFFATLFPFFLLTTTLHHLFIYFAYALYGIMQAGSELSWHMSGLVFAGEKDSTTFSVTNVLTVGIRGCIVPAFGALLLPTIYPLGVILLGAFICLISSIFFFFYDRKIKNINLELNIN